MNQLPQTWQVANDRRLTLDQARLMGILNVTPDSFFDGGAYASEASAAEAALRMWQEGAAIVDVGGESTRPGARAVEAGEQIRRVAGVIRGIRKEVKADDLLISIDTTLSQVAEAALDAGADIINDTSAGRDDERMFTLASSRSCGLILMHRLRPPREDSYSTQYRASATPDYRGDVFGVVREFLRERAEIASEAGLSRESIVIDPGLGFGKSVEQNYELAGRIGELAELGYPVLSAASRKSFVGVRSGKATEPSERLPGTLAISLAHCLAEIRLFRVHDVAAHRQALAVAAGLDRAKIMGCTKMES